MGELNSLVHTIGPADGYFEEMDDGQWDAAFALGTLSGVRSIRAALPLLRAAAWARIAAMSATSPAAPDWVTQLTAFREAHARAVPARTCFLDAAQRLVLQTGARRLSLTEVAKLARYRRVGVFLQEQQPSHRVYRWLRRYS